MNACFGELRRGVRTRLPDCGAMLAMVVNCTNELKPPLEVTEQMAGSYVRIGTSCSLCNQNLQRR